MDSLHSGEGGREGGREVEGARAGGEDVHLKMRQGRVDPKGWVGLPAGV